MTGLRQRGLTLAAVTWFLVVAWCTLRPDPGAVARVAVLPWYCLACGDGGVTDMVLNLLLFLPFGVIARVAGWRVMPTLLVLCGFSIAIEVTQGTLLVGRDASLGDVVCNSLGAVLGWFAWPVLLEVARPGRRFAHAGALVTLGLSAAVWFGTGFAMRPMIGGPAPWYGQWNHPWPAHELFQGSIQRGSLEGMNVPNDSMDRPPYHPDSLDLVLDLTRRIDSVPHRPVSLLRIVDNDQRTVVAVAQRHLDLRLEVRLRAGGLGLRTPEWEFPRSMAVKIGEPWRFRWQWQADRVVLSSGPVSSTAPATASIALSVALGWVLIHPFVNDVGPNEAIWTVLWLAWWFGLLGWFAGATGVRGSVAYGIAGAATFIGASASFGFPIHARELWIGVFAFVVLASIGRRRVKT